VLLTNFVPIDANERINYPAWLVMSNLDDFGYCRRCIERRTCHNLLSLFRCFKTSTSSTFYSNNFFTCVSNGRGVSWQQVFYELDFLFHLPIRIFFLLFALTACPWVFVWGYISDGVLIFPLPLFFVLVACMVWLWLAIRTAKKSLLDLFSLVKSITVDKHGYTRATLQNDIVVCK
jgi:hypothetical protein